MAGDAKITFTAAIYNVLATAYLGRGDYSAAPPDLLDPKRQVTGHGGHRPARSGADAGAPHEVVVGSYNSFWCSLKRRRRSNDASSNTAMQFIVDDLQITRKKKGSP
jgi:hypothetical protein